MAAGTAPSRPPLVAHLLAVGFVTFAVGAAAIDARATYGARTTADEPQYLLTALSLAEDGDLDIADELAGERYLPFHEIAVNPQTIDLDADGQRLSPHDPLLPAILAPAMGVGGWIGAKLALAAIAALTAMTTTWVAVRRFAVAPAIATVVIGGFFATPPLTAYATQVYPEMPAALAVVTAIAALTGRRRPVALGTSLLAVVGLPWLSVKYVPVAVVLGLALIAPLLAGARTERRYRRQAGLIGVAALLAGIVYLVAHQRVYGGWTVYASGDHFVDGEFQVVGTNPNYVGRSRRLVGLLIDRGFGLIPWNPAFLLLAPAVGAVARCRRPSRGWLLAALATGWSVATWVALTMHGWWWPGRQVVVVLPLAVIAIAILVDRHRALVAPTVVGLGVSLIGWLWLVVEASTDRRTLIVDFETTSNPLYQAWSSAFPDHRSFGLGATDLGLTAIWTAVTIASALYGFRLREDQPAATPSAASEPSSVVAESP